MGYLKVSVLGQIGTSEVWSCTVTYRFFQLFDTVLPQEVLDAMAQRLVTAITAVTIPSNLSALLTNQARLTGYRVAQHNESEKIISVGQANYPSPLAGSGTASKTPQDAVVISLRTGEPGARGRGRVYWPAIGAVLNGSFKYTTPGPQGTVDDAVELFNLIGDELNDELAANSYAVTVELAVRSVTNHLSYLVNRLQVGDVLDTQRRRRDAIPEAYVTKSYP